MVIPYPVGLCRPTPAMGALQSEGAAEEADGGGEGARGRAATIPPALAARARRDVRRRSLPRALNSCIRHGRTLRGREAGRVLRHVASPRHWPMYHEVSAPGNPPAPGPMEGGCCGV